MAVVEVRETVLLGFLFCFSLNQKRGHGLACLLLFIDVHSLSFVSEPDILLGAGNEM